MTDPTSARDGAPAPQGSRRVLTRAVRSLSFRNIGALYVWVLIVAFFWWKVPDTFPDTETVKSILNNEAVTGIVALSLVVPLAAGVFDLKVAHIAGVNGNLSAMVLPNTSV